MAQPRKRNTEKKPDRETRKGFNPETWTPKTALGLKVKKGEITSIDQILDFGHKILEPEIVDMLLSNLQAELLEVGQSKGKFGGGKRSIWRQTQKKTKEGNKAAFGTVAICGNGDGYIGIGSGKARETVPAREKATRQSKLNLIKIKRGCGSWECNCGTPHSIPFSVKGKVGSVTITLKPAPKGTKLCVEKECQKILRLAGIKDVYGKARGASTKLNLVYACFEALKKLEQMKVKYVYVQKAGIIAGTRH